MTSIDATSALMDAMRNAGLATTELDRVIPNAGICRFHVDGDRTGSRNGWCVLFSDECGAAGAFGSWRLGITGTWHESGTYVRAANRERVRVAIAEAKRNREAADRAASEAAAGRASAIWNGAHAADPKHPYLARKLVLPHGIRQTSQPPPGFRLLRGTTLLIPAVDAFGRIWTLEGIDVFGTKQFMPGGSKAGHFYAIGTNIAFSTILIAEGFATGASLHEATGYPTVIAFDCGNLERVARAVRETNRSARIVICADNDSGVDGNPGMTHALAAARAIEGELAVPPEPFKDFNDAWVSGYNQWRVAP